MSLKILGLALAMVSPAALAQEGAGPCSRPAETGAVLSLTQAVQLAAGADLRPGVADAGVVAARTEQAIAALRPADTFSLEIEDFPGIGLASEIDNLQVTGQFSRVWERGGKRDARTALARRGVDVAETERQAAQTVILTEVETLYIEAALAERRAFLACERVETVMSLQSAVDRRVEAARDPLLAGARASTDLAVAVADARREGQDAQNLKAALGSYWNAAETPQLDPEFLDRRLTPRAYDFSAIKSPELDRLEAERLRASAQIELEKAQAVPDVTWSVGVRKFGIEDDVAVTGGASIPLGSAGRSEAGAARASAARKQIELQSEAVRQQLIRQALVYQRAALSAADAIKAIDSDLLPEATRALALAEDGYARGAFTYLDVFDAQRALTALREARLDHVRTYVLNDAALARLTGQNDLSGARQETEQ
jgi:outer membrane protein, heavy metal efflux system